MPVAYVEVDLGDPADAVPPSFVISTVPFLYREGELVLPAKAQMYGAHSYKALCSVLKEAFQIAEDLLPPARYFKPNKVEKDVYASRIYRTVPRGAGEPEWRTKARQALLYAVDEAEEQFWTNGTVSVDGKQCASLEQLREELEVLAEAAGGKRRMNGMPYQPDYDVLVQEALARAPDLLQYSRLPKARKQRR